MEKWYDLNQQVHGLLGLSKDQSVRVYPNLQQAVFEIVMGTGLFYSHKKSLAWLKGQTDAFESVMPFLYKESFQVQSYSLLHFRTQYLNSVEWVNGLTKDTNFVLRNEDHPLTAEIFDSADVDKLLNDKKIFSFVVSHSAHLKGKFDVLPYQTLICDYGPDLCIGILGSKFKTPVQTAKYFNFNSEKVSSLIKQAKAISENKMAVEQFEQNMLPPFYPLLEAGKNRIYDRSLFYHEQINADALQTALEKKLNLAGDTLVKSFNLCHQPNLDLSWWEGRPRDTIRRGLLAIAADLLAVNGFASALQEAITECQI